MNLSTANTQSNRQRLVDTKAFGTSSGLGFCLPVGKPIIAFLRPVNCKNASDGDDDVAILTEGRNRFVRSFLHQFKATTKRTAGWLREHVEHDDTRILFMVDDLDRRPIGYMGLGYIDWDQRFGEADAIVRVRDGVPKAMTMALKTLLEWATLELELDEMRVRVRSDNPACDFYRKMGFVESHRHLLRNTPQDDGTLLLIDEGLQTKDIDKLSLVHMSYAMKRSAIETHRSNQHELKQEKVA